jgi:uncharacterized protein (DUF305 family)
MIRRPILYGWLTTLLFVVLSADASANTPAPTDETSRYEVDFMTGMIDHHAMAVEMANICLERASHAELLEMCNNIRAAQTSEIRTMQSWLAQWYGRDYKPRMSKAERAQLRELSQASGPDFEIAFMQSMVEHHQAAIAEAGECLGSAYHRELIQLCGSIAAAQAQEIVTLRVWLCDWYRVCILESARRELSSSEHAVA